MTDDEKKRAIEYITFKFSDNGLPYPQPLDALNYVLDHIDEFKDLNIIVGYLDHKNSELKQNRILELEKELAELKK